MKYKFTAEVYIASGKASKICFICTLQPTRAISMYDMISYYGYTNNFVTFKSKGRKKVEMHNFKIIVLHKCQTAVNIKFAVLPFK